MSFDEMQRVIRNWSQGEFETSMLHRSLAFLTMKYSQIPRVCCLFVWNVCYGGDGIINILERICRFLSNLILQDSHVCRGRGIKYTDTSFNPLENENEVLYVDKEKPGWDCTVGKPTSWKRASEVHEDAYLVSKGAGTKTFLFPNQPCGDAVGLLLCKCYMLFKLMFGMFCVLLPF